jgi:urease accessory protein
VTAAPHPADPGRLQRARGRLALSFAPPDRPGGISRLADLFQHDPCRALLPAPDPGEPLTAILITTSGGLTGGDRLDLSVAAGAGSTVLCTPQAAEKIYRAGDDEAARIDLRLAIGAGARLEWLPQEMILFDGARLRRDIAVDLEGPDARLLAGDITVFGRIARGERFGHGLLADRWRLRRYGRLVWTDALRLEDDIAARLASAAGFAGAVAQGLILHAGPEPEAARDALRGIMADQGMAGAGATVIGGLLLVRLLDDDAARLRRHFALLWAALRPYLGQHGAMPRLWRL